MLNLALMGVMIVSLVEARWEAAYGVTILLIALAIPQSRHRRPGRRESQPGLAAARHGRPCSPS